MHACILKLFNLLPIYPVAYIPSDAISQTALSTYLPN